MNWCRMCLLLLPWAWGKLAIAGGGLTRKRHTMPHPAQPRHTNDGAARTRKQHQQEYRPQRLTERSDPTQHAKGRTGDRPGPVKDQQPDGMSHGGSFEPPKGGGGV